ncbi:hypothetical protein BSNK01_03390 [Bacillaceae bacterium]
MLKENDAKKRLLLYGCFLILLGALAYPVFAEKGDDAAATVTPLVDRLHVRTGPGTQHAVITKVNKGETYPFLGKKGDWYTIRLPDGRTGWVAAWLAEKKPSGEQGEPIAQRTAVVSVPVLNVRAEPDTLSGRIGRLRKGDSIVVTAFRNGWYRMRHNGLEGWVAGRFIEVLPPGLEDKTIVIDPGHGGRDSGARGSHFRTLEKDVNLQIARRLAEKLRKAGANVILTRMDDRYVSLAERVESAAEHDAHAFISIHHNSHENPALRGAITYFFTDGEDRTLAGLIQREIVRESDAPDLKARRGDYFVLRENPQLAVLVEVGFLTNREDERNLRSERFQDHVATGIFRGIERYFRHDES